MVNLQCGLPEPFESDAQLRLLPLKTRTHPGLEISLDVRFYHEEVCVLFGQIVLRLIVLQGAGQGNSSLGYRATFCPPSTC